MSHFDEVKSHLREVQPGWNGPGTTIPNDVAWKNAEWLCAVLVDLPLTMTMTADGDGLAFEGDVWQLDVLNDGSMYLWYESPEGELFDREVEFDAALALRFIRNPGQEGLGLVEASGEAE